MTSFMNFGRNYQKTTKEKDRAGHKEKHLSIKSCNKPVLHYKQEPHFLATHVDSAWLQAEIADLVAHQTDREGYYALPAHNLLVTGQ